MVNRPKNIGTAGESAVVHYLRAHGFAGAERRALAGSADLGDITGCGPVVFEVKAGKAAQNAGAAQTKLIDEWMAQTLCETQNARADYGLLVCKRAGVGAANAGLWWCFLRYDDFLALHGQHRPIAAVSVVRITLAEAVSLLRHAGYGDEPAAVAS